MAQASLPIDNRVLVALTNKFLTESVKLLNNVCVTAEDKMMKIHQKIQRIEDSIAILDGKLDSVPGIADSVVSQVAPSSTQVTSEVAGEVIPEVKLPTEEPETGMETQPPVEKVKTLAEDERYSKYFKMLKMGVPLQAVKNKMAVEGLDGNVLDTPDTPAAPAPADSQSSAGEDSDGWE